MLWTISEQKVPRQISNLSAVGSISPFLPPHEEEERFLDPRGPYQDNKPEAPEGEGLEFLGDPRKRGAIGIPIDALGIL